MNPVLEGNETFTVFLSSALGSSLIQPYIATVVIQDQHLDGRYFPIIMNPVLEGNETIAVFLSSALGSSLTQPYIATVVIQDDLDGMFYPRS